MINRALEHRISITQFISVKKPKLSLSLAEWELLETYLPMLKIFKKCTLLGSLENPESISKGLIQFKDTIDELEQLLRDSRNNPQLVLSIKAAIAKLLKYDSAIEADCYWIAAGYLFLSN